jgi:spermidine/putrescine transport system ATP-binding protein
VPSGAREDRVEDGVSEESVVDLVGVGKSFHGKVAVEDLTLSLKGGEFFSLLGPSGCGKTTTLRMIGGFETPDTGEVVLLGRPMGKSPPNRRPVNTVFQSYALFGHLTVFDNVAFGLKEARRPRSEIGNAVRQALALVRLEGYDARRPRQLSGGEQQRVAVARAIVNEPAVLLLDEPLGALDLKLRRAMQMELKSIQRRLGITFLYVTHDQEEALVMSDRIGVMEAGRLMQVGSPEEIYARPTTPYVADFVGEANILGCEVVEAGSGSASVRLAAGPLALGRGTDLSPGAKARMVIRPENIDVGLEADLSENGANVSLTGTVLDAFFIGSHHRFVVQFANSERIAVLVPSRGGGRRPAVGESVRVTWGEDDCWVIPEE